MPGVVPSFGVEPLQSLQPLIPTLPGLTSLNNMTYINYKLAVVGGRIASLSLLVMRLSVGLITSPPLVSR